MLLVLLWLALQLPGQETRGPAPPPPQIVVQPTPDGFDIGIHWGELAAICSVLSAAYFGVTKFVVAPMIENKFNEFTKRLEDKYMDREAIMAHIALDDQRNEAIEKRLDQIWDMVSK